MTCVGDILTCDWTLPNGWVREVIAVWRAEDLERMNMASPYTLRGSSAERCALYGGRPREPRRKKVAA